MKLNVRPILSALRYSWVGPTLVALQIAAVLAVLVNAVYFVKQRVERIARPTGIDLANVLVVRSAGFAQNYDHLATIREDLDYLKSVRGVVAAAAIDFPPLSGRGNTMGVMLVPDDQTHAVGTHYYEMTEDGLDALGVELVAGRKFEKNEVIPPRTGNTSSVTAPSVIITRALADDLFPKGDALGNQLYDSFGWLGHPATIVGIVETMHGGRVASPRLTRVLLVPRIPYPDEPVIHYVLRTQPGERDTVRTLIQEHLISSNPTRIVEWVRPLQFFHSRSYLTDRNISVFLVVITAALLALGAVGIFGLTHFNVSARTKQIGIRRALGARRRDILSYFIVENWLVATTGVVLGCLLALGVGYWLAKSYELPRLDLYYLAGGVPVIWLIALLAAWHPARRAAAVSPAEATRTL